MKERSTLKKLFLFRLNECDAVKEYLEEMALEGWKLKDIKTFFYFEKIEPQKLIYSVEVFDKASIYDTRAESKTMEYIDYCKEAGWDYICSLGKLNVFVTTDENAVPIETDEVLKFNVIKKTMFRQMIIPWATLLNLLFCNNMLIIDFERFITVNFRVFALFLTIVGFFYLGGQMIIFLVWCKRTKKKLLKGESFKYLNKKDLKKQSILSLIPLALLLIIFIWIAIISYINKDYSLAISLMISTFAFIAIFCIMYFIKKSRLRRSANVVLLIFASFALTSLIVIVTFTIASSLEISKAEPLLNGKDFGIKYATIYWNDNNESVLAKRNSCMLSDLHSQLVNYTVFQSNNSNIIDYYIRLKFREPGAKLFKKVDIPIWCALSVYRNHSDTIVIYKNCVFSYSADAPLSDDVIKKILEKLDVKK